MAKAVQASIIYETHSHVQTAIAESRAAGVQPLLALFVFLVSLREELRTRKDTVTRAKRNAALVDAIAAEPDVDDWTELEAMYRAQRRGTTKQHGGRR
jgi:hypothetical protein